MPTERPGRRGPGRPRSEETDRRIHDATLRLLREGGPAAVTVEAVAGESGVAKTTIYRRYDDRAAVLRAALSSRIVPPSEAVGETPRDKLRWALEQAWRQMEDVLGRGGVSAILTNSHPPFTTLFRTVLEPYADALVDLVRADIAARELRKDVEPETVVSLVLGAYLGEVVRRGRVTKKFSEQCVDLMWRGMAR